MYPGIINQAKVDRLVNLVAQFDGNICREDLLKMMKCSSGVISMLIGEAVKQKRIYAPKGKRGCKAFISIVKESQEPAKNWFEGWGGAVKLGL